MTTTTNQETAPARRLRVQQLLAAVLTAPNTNQQATQKKNLFLQYALDRRRVQLGGGLLEHPTLRQHQDDDDADHYVWIRLLLQLRKGETRLERSAIRELLQSNITLSDPTDLIQCRQSLEATKLTTTTRSSSALHDDNAFVLEPVEDEEVAEAAADPLAEDVAPPHFSCHVTTLGRSSSSLRHYDNITMVACALHHTLFLSRDGTVYATGHGPGLGVEDGLPRPQPVPILHGGVCAIAAGEQHSLFLRQEEEEVYACGSHRWGQTGIINSNNSTRTPQRVPMPHTTDGIVALAAGARHSVALDRSGHVYCWGDNRAGQLGRPSYGGGGIRRVDGNLVVCQIAAADVSTVALCRDNRTVVYSWGHGTAVPTRVVLPSCASHIACGKYHTVAVCCEDHTSSSSSSSVYTWGWHAVGQQRLSARQPTRVPTDQRIVSAACSEHHTVLLTDQGHVYSIGDGHHSATTTTSTNNTKEQEQQQQRWWQAQPERIPEVHRAVAVAAAKDYTAVLVATVRPPVPPPTVSSLADAAARVVMQHGVDTTTVIPIWITAERVQCTLLNDYCKSFVKCNMEAVLQTARRSELDAFVKEQLREAASSVPEDDLSARVLLAGSRYYGDEELCGLDDWMTSSLALLESDAELTKLWEDYMFAQQQEGSGRRRSQSLVGTTEAEGKSKGRSDSVYCSERCDTLLSSLDYTSKVGAQSTLAALGKEVRAIRKRLGQIQALVEGERESEWTSEQRRKVERRVLLEADLEKLLPAMETMRDIIRDFVVSGEDAEDQSEVEPSTSAHGSLEEGCPKPTTISCEKDLAVTKAPEVRTTPSLRCETCQIVCPDGRSLELHLSGRKHRNRVAQVAAEEQKIAASALQQDQFKQSLVEPIRASLPKEKACSNPWEARSMKQSGAKPKFKLPPPPHPIGELEDPTSIGKPSLKLELPLNAPTSFKKMPWASAPAVVLELPSKNSSQGSSKTLHEIMAEEENLRMQKRDRGQKAVAHTPKSSVGKKATSSATGDGRIGCTLGGFLPSLPSPSPVLNMPVTGWVSPSPVQLQSFRDIQKEEHEFQADASYANASGTWFIERKERAGSFHAIQQKEAAEREHERMVEEQKQIERQIYEQLELKSKVDTKQEVKKKTKRQTRRKPKTKTQPKKAPCKDSAW